MKEESKIMVLRSIYLPKNIDDRLRTVAFSKHISKGELIRQAVEGYLEKLEKELADEERERYKNKA